MSNLSVSRNPIGFAIESTALDCKGGWGAKPADAAHAKQSAQPEPGSRAQPRPNQPSRFHRGSRQTGRKVSANRTGSQKQVAKRSQTINILLETQGYRDRKNRKHQTIKKCFIKSISQGYRDRKNRIQTSANNKYRDTTKQDSLS